MGKQSRSQINTDKYVELCQQLDKSRVTDVEVLAQAFHESGREAVLKNKVLKPDGAPVGQIVFKEWVDLPEDAKEGRRIQARYFIGKYKIYTL